jgi:pimeloyl-ACP methyl ester carboxylesterase
LSATLAMMHYPLAVDGTLRRVLQAGSGDDSVLFLHGGNSNANRWRGSLEATSLTGRRALAVDLPGRGFAVADPGPLTVPAFASFVEHFLDVMEIESASLVGAFEIHDSLPGSYLAIVEGAGHDADLDRNELFRPLLLGMLDTGVPEASSAETTLKGPA